MNSLITVPIEMYTTVLYKLDPLSLFQISTSDKYASIITGDPIFWKNYLKFNYDPNNYGLDSWSFNSLSEFWDIYNISNNSKINMNNMWKEFVKLMVYGREIDIFVSHTKIPMTIYLNDTLEQLFQRYLQTLKNNNFKDVEYEDDFNIYTLNRKNHELYDIWYWESIHGIKYSIRRYFTTENGIVHDKKIAENITPDTNPWFNIYLKSSLFNNNIVIKGPRAMYDHEHGIATFLSRVFELRHKVDSWFDDDLVDI
jgi:hypothetical protein